ncbi:hypothetical protein LCGC14_3023620 [marine sediment metagenome]|uniref:Uncharacterized protein n=1 Tax=marine sediment metagenome TaxID=412755 RepID=A0A0F8ZKN4_9ZZZZ
MIQIPPEAIREFFESAVWEEIAIREERELKTLDGDVENPDPFKHGIAVGKRRKSRLFLDYEKILMAEANGKSAYGGK